MSDKKNPTGGELTLEHLSRALAHAEGYLKAVRQVLNTLDPNAVSFPQSEVRDTLARSEGAGWRTGDCPDRPWRIGVCPPPQDEEDPLGT